MNEKVRKAAELFGAKGELELLPGGLGTSYRAGGIVIKPILTREEAEEVAEIIHGLPENGTVRLPKPVRSINGNWIEEDYSAWHYVEGYHVKGEYQKKLEVCRLFSEALKNVPRPPFMDVRPDPWSVADRVAWDEISIHYDPDFQSLIDSIRPHLVPSTAPFQLIHGDISCNILFSDTLPPAVIDITLYWRPADYALAMFVMDAVFWESAPDSVFHFVKDVPNIKQLLLRATIAKIAEEAERVKFFKKDKTEAASMARTYFTALQKFNLI